MTKSKTQDVTRLLNDVRLRMATKADLKKFATKDDLVSLEKRLRNEMASKEDLTSLEKRLRNEMATKQDLVMLRDDMDYKFTSLETRLRQDMTTKTDLETAVAQIIEAVDKSSADKGEVSRLKTRVDRIEDHLNLTPLK